MSPTPQGTQVTSTTTHPVPGPSRAPEPRRAAGWVLSLALPLGALVVVCLLAVALGARSVDLATTLDALRALVTGHADAVSGNIDAAAVLSRVPRTVTAVIVGAGLAVSGVAIQGATRNPLGDPALLGLTAGASLAVAVGLALGLAGGLASVLVSSVIGTLGAAVVVYVVASASQNLDGFSLRRITLSSPDPLALILAGAAVTAGAMAGTTALLISSPAVLERFRFWNVGSVARADLSDALWLAPVALAAILVVVALAPGLDALALGDDLAHGLGANPQRVRVALFAAVIVLSATATALAGPIAFVGLMVPHALRRFAQANHRELTIAAALWGAVLVVAADLLGRVVIAPQEIHVGVSTVVLGAPLLLVLLRRRRFV